MNRDHLKAGEKACMVRETHVIQYLSVFEVTGVNEVKCNTEKVWGEKEDGNNRRENSWKFLVSQQKTDT